MAENQSKQTENIKGMKVAILATEGVEQVELTEPRKALIDAGAEVTLVSPIDSVQMWNHHDRGDQIKSDARLADVKADDFDALVLPGGVMNPDQLRTNEMAVSFVRSFADQDKPIAAICHGPWMLVEADIARGHQLTSWPALQTDLRNAGAEWKNETVIRDGHLVTSRNPKDIPNFNREMIRLFSEKNSEASTAQRKTTQPQKEGTQALH